MYTHVHTHKRLVTHTVTRKPIRLIFYLHSHTLTNNSIFPPHTLTHTHTQTHTHTRTHTHTQSLSLEHNSITKIPLGIFSQAEGLTSLTLKVNQIATLPLGKEGGKGKKEGMGERRREW